MPIFPAGTNDGCSRGETSAAVAGIRLRAPCFSWPRILCREQSRAPLSRCPPSAASSSPPCVSQLLGTPPSGPSVLPDKEKERGLEKRWSRRPGRLSWKHGGPVPITYLSPGIDHALETADTSTRPWSRASTHSVDHNEVGQCVWVGHLRTKLFPGNYLAYPDGSIARAGRRR